jgi:hypothetical protein
MPNRVPMADKPVAWIDPHDGVYWHRVITDAPGTHVDSRGVETGYDLRMVHIDTMGTSVSVFVSNHGDDRTGQIVEISVAQNSLTGGPRTWKAFMPNEMDGPHLSPGRVFRIESSLDPIASIINAQMAIHRRPDLGRFRDLIKIGLQAITGNGHFAGSVSTFYGPDTIPMIALDFGTSEQRDFAKLLLEGYRENTTLFAEPVAERGEYGLTVVPEVPAENLDAYKEISRIVTSVCKTARAGVPPSPLALSDRLNSMILIAQEVAAENLDAPDAKRRLKTVREFDKSRTLAGIRAAGDDALPEQKEILDIWNSGDKALCFRRGYCFDGATSDMTEEETFYFGLNAPEKKAIGILSANNDHMKSFSIQRTLAIRGIALDWLKQNADAGVCKQIDALLSRRGQSLDEWVAENPSLCGLPQNRKDPLPRFKESNRAKIRMRIDPSIKEEYENYMLAHPEEHERIMREKQKAREKRRLRSYMAKRNTSAERNELDSDPWGDERYEQDNREYEEWLNESKGKAPAAAASRRPSDSDADSHSQVPERPVGGGGRRGDSDHPKAYGGKKGYRPNSRFRPKRFLPEEREAVKRGNRLEDYLAEKGVQFTRRSKGGTELWACCPFHDEQTASFSVNTKKQTWYCQGACSEGGDIISAVRKLEGMNYPQAIRYLGSRIGITEFECDKPAWNAAQKGETILSPNAAAVERGKDERAAAPATSRTTRTVPERSRKADKMR